jgi:hypothetical protein
MSRSIEKLLEPRWKDLPLGKVMAEVMGDELMG